MAAYPFLQASSEIPTWLLRARWLKGIGRSRRPQKFAARRRERRRRKGAGPNLEAWLSRRVLATSGSLARLVCCTVHPCPPFGRTWQLLPIYVAVEHGQSHSEAGRKGHSLSGTTLAFQYCRRLSTKGKVVWQSIKRNMQIACFVTDILCFIIWLL